MARYSRAAVLLCIALLAATCVFTASVGNTSIALAAKPTHTPRPTATATPVPTPTPTPTPTPPPSTNLALNRPATASSVEAAGLEAGMAVDGSLTTRWSSLDSDPQWIYVDLGAAYVLNRVVLTWEAAYGTAYQVQVSPDASAWTSIFSTTTGDGATDDLTVTGTGRYVRMYGTTRVCTCSGYGYSLFEFEVYGGPSPTPTPTATPTPTPTPTPPPAAGQPVLCAGPARVGRQLLDVGQTMSCGTVDAQGAAVGVEMRDNSTLDGVEIFNTGSSSGSCCGIFVNGNGVTIHDCSVHNTSNDGISINRDGDTVNGGIKNLTITNCLIQDTGEDGIHIKGTNRGDGQAPSQFMAMENIRITYTKSLRANDAPGFGFEFQDGQLNCYFAYNDSDRTYSVVGHTGLQMIGNTVTAPNWGYEVGNMIGSTWDNNLSTGASTGFAFTGDTVNSNMNTTYSNNRVSSGSEGFNLGDGSYNTFTTNGFHNVTTWFQLGTNYDQSHDVTTGSFAY